jgi:sortase A
MYTYLRAASMTLILFGVAAVLVYAWQRVDEQLYQVTQRSYLPAVSPAAAMAAGAPSSATAEAPTVVADIVRMGNAVLPSRILPRRWTAPDPNVIGRLVIPKLSMDVVIREGADAATLRRAVGHLPASALPGTDGNFVVTGHRDTFFRSLRNIRKDDEVIAVAPYAIHTYRVYEINIVSPDYVQALRPTSQPECTLVTCFPFDYIGAAPRRYIVHARLVRSAQL